MPQSYVIATQTKIDISGVDLPEHLDDDYFKREKRQRKRTEEMFEEEKEVRVLIITYFIEAIIKPVDWT